MSKKIKIFLLGCALMVMCCMGITAGASDHAKVIAHNLTITDEGISVNFYVDIDVEAQNDIKVTLNGSQVEIPAEPTEIIIDAKAYSCYKFTQPVVAKEMDDKVSLSVVAGEEELVTDSYSVNDYVAEVQAGGYGYNFENLANAMTYYGEFAEVYLKYNNATSASEKALASIDGFNEDVLDAYAMTKGSEYPEGLTYYGTQLNLNSEITLRMCFQLEEGKTAEDYGNITAVSTDGTKDLGVLKKGSYKDTQYYYVDIANIGADALGKSYEIKADDKTLLSNCSVLSYANAVVNKYGNDAAKVDLANLSKALYLYSEKANLYVASQTVAVYDIFYSSEGFSATPDEFTQVYLTSNGDVTTESTGNTPVTILSQLNDSRTKGCSVWMQTAYTVADAEETFTGSYVIRRYTDNINVLNITGTATLEATVDGSLGEFAAQYPGGIAKVEISQADNGEVYVSGTLTVKGSAKSGLITTSTADITVIADGLTKDAEIIFPAYNTQMLTGTGEASAIDLVDSGDGHFGAIETTKATEETLPNLTLGSIICVCGDNVSEDSEHSCAWTKEQTNGLEAAYNIPWQPVASTATTLPITNGSYYLTRNLTGIMRSQIESGNEVNLDLAGFTAQGPGTSGDGRIYRVKKGTLNIADSSPNQKGTIKSEGGAGAGGLAVYVWGNGTNAYSYGNIFGGTFEVSGNVEDSGATVAVSNGCLNVYDGTVKGKVLVFAETSSLNIFGDAQVGIKNEEQPEQSYGIATAYTIEAPHVITCTNVTGQESIVLKNLEELDITGTGRASAIKFIEDGAGHFGVYETTAATEGTLPTLNIGSVICGCGANISQDPTHSCGWVIAQGEVGIQAVYDLEWTATTSLPTSDGSYYLTDDIKDVNAKYSINDSSSVVNLDLAGWRVEGIGHQDAEGDDPSGTVGLIYRVQQGTLNIADSSEDQTGAIYMSGETNDVGAMAVWTNDTAYLNIFGGTISAKTGTAVTIRIGHINMYGGMILPGTKPEGHAYANAVQIGTNQTNKTYDLNVFGGTIKGEVLISKSGATVDITGDAKVGIADDDTSKPYGIGTTEKITTTQTINFSNTSGEIVLKDTNYLALAEGATGDAGKFTIIDQHNKVVDDNAEGMGDLSFAPQMCVCGAVGEHTQVGNCAVPTSAWNALSSWNISNTASGSYYLINDITASSSLDFTNYQIDIDLAGYTIDAEGSVTYMFQPKKTSVLNITDSAGGGVIKNAYQGEATAYGTVILLPNGTHTDACANLYAGTLTSAGGKLGTNTILSTVYIGVGTFSIYDGIVEDNLDENKEDDFMAVRNVNGTINAFQAGYGKVDISPEVGVSLGSYGNQDKRLTTEVLTPLEAVATAVTDLEGNTLILVVTDLSWGKITYANQIRELVYDKYGIPKENVLVGGTHNHSAPDPSYTTNELNVTYVAQWKTNVMSAIDKAMKNRQPATMEVGSTETVDMVFSRRYLCEDGLYQGGGPSSYDQTTSPVVAHETGADEEIQMLRFVREGAKDILITQWQSHACNISWDRTEGSDHYKASGEWPQVIRSTLETELGVHCMYMQGAAGNLASMSEIEGENLYNAESDPEAGTIGYNDFQAIGEKVASYVIDAYQAENGFKKVESGLIQVNQYNMPAILRENESEATGTDMPQLNTVAIGNVSLVTLPSELFDTSAVDIKNATPFAMTLIMGYTCGNNLYEAPAWAVEHGCYEVEHGRYKLGTAEDMVNHYIDTLESLYATR